jgi:uncharacterized protein (TIGR02996 family)
MSTLAGLLEAIHESPADETSWLVLADWLEENDEPPRAELLRLHRGLRKRLPAAKRRQGEERIMALLAAGVKPCVPTRASSAGLELNLIPAGSFRMGSPQPEARRMDDEYLHTVTLTRSFYLGAHLVTQEQYRLVMGSTPSHFTRRRKGCRGQPTEHFPVDRVRWGHAQEFCAELTERDGTRKVGWVYRLPSEAEWEYACRAWFSSRWPFHHGAALTPQMANFDGRYPYPPDHHDESGVFLERPSVVGSYPPNAFGLYDMHGNLDEWCLDYHSEMTGENEVDPLGPEDGDERVVRGGSWRGQGEDCRTAVRIGEYPEEGHSYVGFRVALVRAPEGR